MVLSAERNEISRERERERERERILLMKACMYILF